MLLDSLRKNKKHPVFSGYRKPHVDDVVEAISLMDVHWLEYLLDENLTYSDFPKWVFIKKLKSIFDYFKEIGDTHLNYYPGESRMTQHIVSYAPLYGYRFVGNELKNYLDLVFETERDYVWNIVDCEDLRSPGTELFIREKYFLRYRIVDGWNSSNERPF